MKKLIYSLFAVALLGLAACDPNGSDGGASTQSYVDYSRGKIKLMLPSSKNVKADADGVSVSIKEVTNANVTFECRPGANVGSYRMDVIPLAMLYNTIINEGLVGAPVEDIEDLIIKLLEESTSTNKVVFNEESLDNFYSQNFDWMSSTEYRNGDILCDCDYVICIVPCYDEEGTDPNGVNLAWFKTSAPALVGDPDVRIDVTTSYRAFNAVHEPNDDCKYVAYWSYITEQIDDYEDVVGERMLRDFIRCASPSYSVANLSDLSYYIDFAQAADAAVSQTCVAVALDKNGTPADYVARRNFYLKTIPDSPEAVYSIKPYKSAASIFWIKVNFEPTCKNCYYRWLSEEEAAKIQAYSEENRKAYARDLAQYGWGVKNYKFSFDVDENKPTGDLYEAIEHQIVAYQPKAKYVIVSAGENFYGEVTDLQFCEVELKPRVIDNPSSCLVSDDEFKLTLDNVSRTGFRYNFNYTNHEEVAIYYFQVVSPVDADAREKNPEMCPPEDVYNATHADWMKFFFETPITAEDGEKVLQVNTWHVEESGHDAMSMFGYEPNTEYVVAYCVEDMNGVVSDVRLEKVRTTPINAGANPRAEVSAELKDGEWRFTFTANEDTGTLYYMTSSFGDENYEKLGLYALPEDLYGDGFDTYNSFHDIWEENMLNLGLTTNSLQTYATEKARTDKKVILALCQPVGANADGKPVYGDLQHVLIVDGQVKHLSDYRTKPE